MISEKNNRIIPITNKEFFNNLVKLYKDQQDLKTKRIYGDDSNSYALFDELSISTPKRFFESANSLWGSSINLSTVADIQEQQCLLGKLKTIFSLSIGSDIVVKKRLSDTLTYSNNHLDWLRIKRN